MATSKRYVPPLSKSKGSAGAAGESTRRLDDLVQDSIFTVKLGSKNNYSESKSEKSNFAIVLLLYSLHQQF